MEGEHGQEPAIVTHDYGISHLRNEGKYTSLTGAQTHTRILPSVFLDRYDGDCVSYDALNGLSILVEALFSPGDYLMINRLRDRAGKRLGYILQRTSTVELYETVCIQHKVHGNNLLQYSTIDYIR